MAADRSPNPVNDAVRSLNDTIRLVRERQADRDDAVAERSEVERERLKSLADAVRPFFKQIDETDERFELALSTGDHPRLWLDATTFVAVGQDKRTYRLLKDTSLGRTVMSETDDADRAANLIGEYIAERVLERQRMLEGDRLQMLASAPAKADGGLERRRPSRFFWFLMGVIATLAIVAFGALLLVPSAL